MRMLSLRTVQMGTKPLLRRVAERPAGSPSLSATPLQKGLFLLGAAAHHFQSGDTGRSPQLRHMRACIGRAAPLLASRGNRG